MTLPRSRVAGLLAVFAVVAAAGCGGSGDSDGDDSAGRECVARWNDIAQPGFRAIVAISSEPDVPILAGEYSGESFDAEAFDATRGGTRMQVSVASGDCVVAQKSADTTLFVFVLPARGAGAGAWHRLSETGGHPLAQGPEGLVAAPGQVRVAGEGAQSRLVY